MLLYLPSFTVVRIFLGLSVVALVLLVVNLFIGLGAGDLQAAKNEYQHEIQVSEQLRKEAQRDVEAVAAQELKLKNAAEHYQAVSQPMMVHLLLGTLAALVTVLVNSISITYFIGTSRWCKEVSETFGLGPEYPRISALTKRRSFVWSLLGIFTILGIISLGAAADARGANREHAANFVLPHYLSALGGIAVIGIAFWKQGQSMLANHQLIDEIMQRVQRVREERKETAGSPRITDLS